MRAFDNDSSRTSMGTGIQDRWVRSRFPAPVLTVSGSKGMISAPLRGTPSAEVSSVIAICGIQTAEATVGCQSLSFEDHDCRASIFLATCFARLSALIGE